MLLRYQRARSAAWRPGSRRARRAAVEEPHKSMGAANCACFIHTGYVMQAHRKELDWREGALLLQGPQCASSLVTHQQSVDDSSRVNEGGAAPIDLCSDAAHDASRVNPACSGTCQ